MSINSQRPQIKAIETKYKGYRFRSKAARSARFEFGESGATL